MFTFANTRGEGVQHGVQKSAFRRLRENNEENAFFIHNYTFPKCADEHSWTHIKNLQSQKALAPHTHTHRVSNFMSSNKTSANLFQKIKWQLNMQHIFKLLKSLYAVSKNANDNNFSTQEEYAND